MAKKETKPKAEAMHADSKIDAIKHLIFGDNIEEYSQEFDTLKKELEQRRKELSDFIDDTRKELMSAIDNLGTDLNIRVSDLEESLNERTENLDNTKIDKSQLGNLLIKMGEKIQS